MKPLDRLVERDIFREAMELLTPRELAVARLRLEGLNDDQIGALLGTSRLTISKRMVSASRRIMKHVPELAPVLTGRHRTAGPTELRSLPLERGWVCDDLPGLADLPAIEPYISTADAADLLGTSRQSLLRLCTQARMPGARYDGFRWLIPESALEPDGGERV